MGVFHHAVHIVDRAAGDPVFRQVFKPMLGLLCLEDLLKSGNDLRSVDLPVFIAPVFIHLQKCFKAKKFAGPLPYPVVSDAHIQKTVFCPEGLVDGNGAAPVGIGDRQLSGGEIADNPGCHKRDNTIHKRNINKIPQTCEGAPVQTRDNGKTRLVGGQDITGRCPHFFRMIVISGYTHDTANSLGDQIIAGAISVRACVAKSRDGTIDESRVWPLQVFIRKPQLFKCLKSETDHKHISFSDELFEQFRPLWVTDV